MMTALVIPFVALPVTILFILGLILIYRRKLIISSSKEISGYPVVLLGVVYILISVASITKAFYFSGDLLIDYPIVGLCVFVATVISMFFMRPRTAI